MMRSERRGAQTCPPMRNGLLALHYQRRTG